MTFLLFLKILCIIIFMLLPAFFKIESFYSKIYEKDIRNKEDIEIKDGYIDSTIMLPKIQLDQNLLADISTINQECLNGLGMWIGEDNLETNTCETFCNSSSSFYQYYNESDIIVNGVHNKKGGYCRINQNKERNYIKCNKSTSIAVLSDNIWICQPKIPQFGGENGTEILICDGIIIDRLTNFIHVNFIPKTYSININEVMPDGFYRFVCSNLVKLTEQELKDKVITSTTKKMLEDVLKFKIVNSNQPFEYIENYCLKYFNKNIIKKFANRKEIMENLRPNFETGECNCNEVGLENLYHNKNKPCIPNKYGINYNNNINNEDDDSNITIPPSGDDIDEFKKFSFTTVRPCIMADFVNNFEKNTIEALHLLETPYIYPCGVDNFTKDADSKLVKGIILPSLKYSPYVSAILNS